MTTHVEKRRTEYSVQLHASAPAGFVEFVNQKRDKSRKACVGHGEFFGSRFRPITENGPDGASRPDHGREPRPWLHPRRIPRATAMDPHPECAPRECVGHGRAAAPC